ncbi:IgGFc-binding protein [Varanus komodoensis]|nr:IgGFc-binding protein [Varanus komodoensis]
MLYSLSAHAANARGKKFVTAFMQNDQKSHPNQPETKYELLITGHHSATMAKVTVNKSMYRRTVPVKEGQTVKVRLPSTIEMVGSDTFDGTVLIQADKDISVFAQSQERSSIGTTVVYPVEQLGTLYYVLTPPGDRANTFKEFTVIASETPTKVIIDLKGAVTFKGQVYPAGKELEVDLKAFQAIQLQSSDDLSGTKVESTETVAVLSGHSCADKNSQVCNHVIEQLLPVTSWGTFFIVPQQVLQDRDGIVYIMASQSTYTEYHHGHTQKSQTMESQQVIQLNRPSSEPMFISASTGIQVLFFFAATEKRNNGPFLINIPGIANYCRSYDIDGMSQFDNYAVIVAKTSETEGIVLGKTTIGNVQWRPIPDSEYSWAEYSLAGNAASFSLEHPSSPFGLYILGVSQYGGYGSVAVCSSDKLVPSCSLIRCKKEEKCEIMEGHPTCAAESASTCIAHSGPHYQTFDGKNFDFTGACTYTIARTFNQDADLPYFHIEVTNENRDNTHVPYTSLVSVTAYNHTISQGRNEMGLVRVNGLLRSPPVSLSEEKITVTQQSSNFVIKINTGLIVIKINTGLFYSVKVMVPSTYQGLLQGLCGNYNGQEEDEFLLPDGTMASDAAAFGAAWKVPVPGAEGSCSDGCSGSSCPVCEERKKAIFKQRNYCGILTASDGPFRACHSKVDPSVYFDNCVYDVCLGNGESLILCQSIQSYVSTCQEAGVSVEPWRNPSFCREYWWLSTEMHMHREMKEEQHLK